MYIHRLTKTQPHTSYRLTDTQIVSHTQTFFHTKTHTNSHRDSHTDSQIHTLIHIRRHSTDSRTDSHAHRLVNTHTLSLSHSFSSIHFSIYI